MPAEMVALHLTKKNYVRLFAARAPRSFVIALTFNTQSADGALACMHMPTTLKHNTQSDADGGRAR